MIIRDRALHVLSQLSPALATLKDDCFVIGAAALILRGVGIAETMDIDILTSAEDADTLKQLWNDKRKAAYTPDGGDLFRSNFGRFQFDLLDVEVMGGLQIHSNGEWQSVTIKDYDVITTSGYDIKVPTLNELARLLKLFGRTKDLAKLDLINVRPI